MNIPFLDLSSVNAPDLDEMTEAAARVIRSGRYLHGSETAAFEQELAESLQASELQVIGVSNGLDALRLIIRGYIETGRLKPGDEVLFPANTYIASVLPISEAGLVPVAVEPDKHTLNIDLGLIREKLTPRTRALMLVHLYGRPCWNSEVMNDLHSRGIIIIEDNAQAIGAEAATEGFNGSRVTGALADAAAFSFYPTKNVGAAGDAGAVATADRKLAEAVKALANYGSDRRYHNIYRGYNCRLDEIQAAMLRVRLHRMPQIIAQRNVLADTYSSHITLPGLILPTAEASTICVWHQYVVRHPERNLLREWLGANGVQTDIHYAVPPHRQPCYADVDFGPLPVTEMLADTVLSLPIAGVTSEQAKEISDCINGFNK